MTATSDPTGPPTPPRRPLSHTEHGVVRDDPWGWLRDVDSPEVRGHLVAERSWYDVATGHLHPLVEDVRAEMVARTPATDSSVNWLRGAFSYYTRVPTGREHVQLLRYLHRNSVRNPSSGANSSTETVLLDLNVESAGSAYAELGLTRVSPDDGLLAWSVDLTGDEVYTLRFRDLTTGEDLPEEVPRSYYSGAWSADSRHFFYTVHDGAYRPFQVWRHELGTSVEDDALVLTEPDERFELQVRATRSGALVLLWAGSRDTSEVWVVDAADPTSPPRSVGGRRPGVEYHAEHLAAPDGVGSLLCVTDDGAVEFRLVSAPVPRETDQDHTAWRPLRDAEPAVRLERVEAFAGHVVLQVRTQGERRLRVLPAHDLTGTFLEIAPRFEAGSIALGPNEEYDATTLLVADRSYVHPTVWSDVDPRTGERTERLTKTAPGHDPTAYVCERRSFPAPDGTPVGATLVRHRDTALDGTAPALLYGYGAYEAVDEPEWDAALPSLLDRGVVYVHTHIRGGGEGGRRWWLGGRLKHKQNTFSDHVAVADGLAAEGLVDGTRIATRGLSAGGLLQGAVFSQRPDRWRAVVAEVPFVDVVSTMFDASIPLTVNEWDEWGDPRRRADFDWLLGYSPYDNPPPAGHRPDLLVTGALHDPRVMVWEPAKWVARLRETDPEWAPRCLFRCETGAGAHTGPAGRYAHLAYEAEVYAWVLDKLAV
jgi:oligopeptidase B